MMILETDDSTAAHVITDKLIGNKQNFQYEHVFDVGVYRFTMADNIGQALHRDLKAENVPCWFEDR